MLDQISLGTNCQIGPSLLCQKGNNAFMHKSPIKLAKHLTGFTGERLAEELGISAAHLSRMSNNKRRITTDLIDRLARVSNKTPEEFYRLLGTTPGEVEEAAEALTGHPSDEPLMINPDAFRKAYERARTIEETMLGGRGSNADFAVIFEQVYSDILRNEED
ncbi:MULTISPECIES: helix-turn-helix transcriptional regulator [unclassified Roseibium]|uniref:helix-turn-helix transcriptional regulator n=1 Tax=unclassified Roseibium TaxID=2629323 RepID=UPI00273F5949|nr:MULTISPECIES: helix-turn-helix transcriptional regulator [unclassified Roseibium]